MGQGFDAVPRTRRVALVFPSRSGFDVTPRRAQAGSDGCETVRRILHSLINDAARPCVRPGDHQTMSRDDVSFFTVFTRITQFWLWHLVASCDGLWSQRLDKWL